MSSQIGRYSGKQTGGNPGFSSSVENGRIPLALLRRLETQADTPQFPASEHFLAHDAAINFDGMVLAARADGVSIQLLEAYRTYDRQVYFWDRYQAGTGNLAARPGTSNHGWGTAIDVDQEHDSHALPWLKLHAGRYGWDLPDVLGRVEPWHWQAIHGHVVGAVLPAEPETPIYVHGQLVPHAYAANPTGSAVLVFLRPVVEAMGWDVLAVDRMHATLGKDGQTKSVEIVQFTDERAVVSVRLLEKALNVPVAWDGKAVRIG